MNEALFVAAGIGALVLASRKNPNTSKSPSKQVRYDVPSDSREQAFDEWRNKISKNPTEVIQMWKAAQVAKHSTLDSSYSSSHLYR